MQNDVQKSRQPGRLSYFHGVTLRIVCGESWIIKALSPIIGRLPSASAEGRSALVEVYLDVVDVLPELPDGLAHSFEHASTKGLTDGEHLFVVDQHCALRIDACRPYAAGVVAREAADEPWGFQQAMFIALVEVLRRVGMYHAHTACVTNGDRCVLIAGDALSGKTTATIALVSTGWRYVSDDFVLLRNDHGRVVALGWPDEFHVGEAVVQAFGLSDRIGESCGNDRYSLDPTVAFPLARVECAQPAAILFSQIVDSDVSDLCPISKAQALARFIRQTPLVMVSRRWAEGHLTALRDLIAQCKCYDLRAGRDVLQGALPRLLKIHAKGRPSDY